MENSDNTKNNQARLRSFRRATWSCLFSSVIFVCVVVILLVERKEYRETEELRSRTLVLEQRVETVKEKLDLLGKMERIESKIDDLKRELEEIKQKQEGR